MFLLRIGSTRAGTRVGTRIGGSSNRRIYDPSHGGYDHGYHYPHGNGHHTQHGHHRHDDDPDLDDIIDLEFED